MDRFINKVVPESYKDHKPVANFLADLGFWLAFLTA
jgi:hypothetical protein